MYEITLDTGLYYLQSRYYDPEIGRFINADCYASTDITGPLSANMYAYCENNPVNRIDNNGKDCRAVGTGIQLQFQVGSCTAGVEVVLYWDDVVCDGSDFVISVYYYGGVSVETTNPEVAMLVTAMTENANCIEDTDLFASMVMATLLNGGFSGSISAELIVGNDDFTSSKNYEGEFTSFGGSVGPVCAGIAYSDSCTSYSLGYVFSGTTTAKWGVSKTKYYKLCDLNFANNSFDDTGLVAMAR